MRLADILPKSIYLHICIVSLQDVVYTCKHIKLIKKNEKKNNYQISKTNNVGIFIDHRYQSLDIVVFTV